MDDTRNPDTKGTRTTGTLEADPLDSGTVGITGTTTHEDRTRGDANRDPITGAAGAHPVGTGVGAASGGVAGAAIGGAVGGPVGAVVGGAVGAIVGGLAGHGIAEGVNPTVEDAYWRENYASRDYVDRSRPYEEYQPAYRYGWESRGRSENRTWDQTESDLERGWDKFKDESKQTWHEAKHAAKDAWHRVDRNLSADDDTYWRDNYRYQSYADRSRPYDDYEPAYRYGRESHTQYPGRSWDQVENDLERGWERAKGTSHLAWLDVKYAVKDAWHRAERALPGDADRDGR